MAIRIRRFIGLGHTFAIAFLLGGCFTPVPGDFRYSVEILNPPELHAPSPPSVGSRISTIRVVRVDELFGSAVPSYVALDGSPILKLGVGQFAVLEVEEGNHEITLLAGTDRSGISVLFTRKFVDEIVEAGTVDVVSKAEKERVVVITPKLGSPSLKIAVSEAPTTIDFQRLQQVYPMTSSSQNAQIEAKKVSSKISESPGQNTPGALPRPGLLLRITPEENNAETRSVISQFRPRVVEAIANEGKYQVIDAATTYGASKGAESVLTLEVGQGFPDHMNFVAQRDFGGAQGLRVSAKLRNAKTGAILLRFSVNRNKDYTDKDEMLRGAALEVAKLLV